MTSRTAARPRPEKTASLLSRADWRWAIVALVAVGIVLLVSRLDSTPAMVGRVTIENPGEFAFNVDVTNGNRHGWLQLGAVQQKSTAGIEQVVDQGDTWIFHFSGQGEDAGELVLKKSELESAGWRLTVPAAAVERLRSLGVPPTP